MDPNTQRNELSLSPLPEWVGNFCRDIGVPPRLSSHLILVHDVAIKLVDAIQKLWPELKIERETIFFGAATHDIGKSLYPDELVGTGHKHESAGFELLINNSIAENLARFTITHAEWINKDSILLEDLFVALADNCWSGKRNDELENLISRKISESINIETWEAFLNLDNIIDYVSADADKRLYWQGKFSPK